MTEPADIKSIVMNAVFDHVVEGAPEDVESIVDPGLRAVVKHLRANQDASFEYVNHAGVRETRHVAELQSPKMRAELPWYPEPVWLMVGRCLARNRERSFDCAKIENIRPLAAGLWAKAPDSNR